METVGDPNEVQPGQQLTPELEPALAYKPCEPRSAVGGRRGRLWLVATVVLVACTARASLVDAALGVARSLLGDGPARADDPLPELDPAPPDRPTALLRASSDFVHAEYRQRQRHWTRSWMMDAYARRGTHAAAWDAEAEAAIEAYADCVWPADAADFETAVGQVRIHAREARAQGCPDAFIVLLEGYALLHEREEERAGDLLERAVAELASQGYPETLRCLALLNLHGSILASFSSSSRKSQLGSVEKLLAAACLRAAEDGIYGPADLGYFADLFAEVCDVGHTFKPIALALRQPPGPSNPWMNAYVRGHSGTVLLVGGYAWDWATDEGLVVRDGHDEFARTVRQALTSAHQMRPDLPHAATLMICVDAWLTRRGSAAWGWFRLASEACSDWPPAYEHLLRFPAMANLERRPEHGLEVARAVFGSPHPRGDAWQAFILGRRRTLSSVAPLREILTHPDVWPLARASLCTITEDAARSPAQRELAWERLAAAAWCAQDIETAVQAHRMRPRPLSAATAADFQLDIQEFEGLVALASGEAGAPLATAWSRCANNDDADAFRLLLAGLDDPALAPGVRCALRKHMYRKSIRPDCASSLVLAEYLVREGMGERLWKEYQRLRREKMGDARLRDAVARLLGPVAVAAAEMPELDQPHAPQQFGRMRARISDTLGSIGAPEEPDLTQRKLAEVRLLLQLAEDGPSDARKALCRQHVQLELMPAFLAVPDQRAALEVLLEHEAFGTWTWRWEHLYQTFWKEYVDKRQMPLWEQTGVEEGIVVRLDDEQDDAQLLAASRRALMARDSLTLALRVAQLLRRRGLVLAAEGYEARVDRTVRVLTGVDPTPCCVRERYQPGHPSYSKHRGDIEFGWTVAYLYNLVGGYEDRVLSLYAMVSDWYRSYAFVHLFAADAHLRKRQLPEAAACLRKASERPLRGWTNSYTQHGRFAQQSEYLRFLEKALEEAMLESPAGEKLLPAR